MRVDKDNVVLLYPIFDDLHL